MLKYIAIAVAGSILILTAILVSIKKDPDEDFDS